MAASSDIIAQVRHLRANAGSFEDYARGLALIAGVQPDDDTGSDTSRQLSALRRRIRELEARVRELEARK